jgi:alcohol dehydrogenase
VPCIGPDEARSICMQFMGTVATVGPDVKNFRPGDRVVVSCIIACGVCR